MSVVTQNITIIQFFIHFIPNNEVLYWTFENNKNFGDLKNELQEKHKIIKEFYHFEMGDTIIDDDLIFRDLGVKNNSCLYLVRNDYIKIKIEKTEFRNKIVTFKKYVPFSNFKIIKSDENKIIKVCNNKILLFFLFILIFIIFFSP